MDDRRKKEKGNGPDLGHAPFPLEEVGDLTPGIFY